MADTREGADTPEAVKTLFVIMSAFGSAVAAAFDQHMRPAFEALAEAGNRMQAACSEEARRHG
jgi:hypothetical protein